MNTMFKIGGGLIAFGIATEIVYQVYLRWKGKRKDKDPQIITDVLFFPDKRVACLDFFHKPKGCANKNCRYSHSDNSLSELYRHLSSAKKCLDVCVYTICCKELCDILISHHKRGVAVRVVTDNDQLNLTGAQVWRLRSEGVPVRTGNSSYYMHHKFVIVDRELLLNGSFNWTRQAITGNQENLIVMNIPHVVNKYLGEFEKLWVEFNPANVHKSELHAEAKVQLVNGEEKW
ncbi:mitochondrial cardiolipin hydrolase-like [Gigantopelta aegis]|uniref:mitochondrial cardiolipin hydrolase-like n=1 Tax=Gigantopelta aegis TaxID=1735272 RepID=UPI001B888A64|nr:mitochondrial cardiolipin hydrolase-like [Gigantopelta aegis]